MSYLKAHGSSVLWDLNPQQRYLMTGCSGLLDTAPPPPLKSCVSYRSKRGLESTSALSDMHRCTGAQISCPAGQTMNLKANYLSGTL